MATATVLPMRASQKLEWFAVQTRSRHEKSVGDQLRGKQIEIFLPLYRSSKRWKSGQQRAQLPLFPGYLFVRIDIQHQLPVLQTPGVARFVGFGGRPVALPQNEIAQLEAVTKEVVASPHPFLTVGDRVRIKGGPLAGLSGILLRDKQGLRVVLSVELISKSISVELDADDVEPV